jgi:hypothetical protein
MRPWASWTAKTALLGAGFAAAAGGLSSVALAAGSGHVAASAGLPGDVCTSAGAVLGIADAPCPDVTATSVPVVRSAETGPGAAGAPGGPGDQAVEPAISRAVQRAVAPLTATLGQTAPARSGREPVPGLAPLSAATGAPSPSRIAGANGASAPGTDGIYARTPGTPAGDMNVPAATQLAGLGALPGLADLPSSAGLASTAARNGVTGGSTPMPGTSLSAANTSDMSSDSFAALAVGALLAGASALKIAGRRTRDRKAGIGVPI